MEPVDGTEQTRWETRGRLVAPQQPQRTWSATSNVAQLSRVGYNLPGRWPLRGRNLHWPLWTSIGYYFLVKVRSGDPGALLFALIRRKSLGTTTTTQKVWPSHISTYVRVWHRRLEDTAVSVCLSEPCGTHPRMPTMMKGTNASQTIFYTLIRIARESANNQHQKTLRQRQNEGPDLAPPPTPPKNYVARAVHQSIKTA